MNVLNEPEQRNDAEIKASALFHDQFFRFDQNVITTTSQYNTSPRILPKTREGKHRCCRQHSRVAVPLDSFLGLPGGSDHKECACNAGDLGLIPGFGRSPGEGSGNPLQYSCLENPRKEEPGRLQSMGSQRVRHD